MALCSICRFLFGCGGCLVLIFPYHMHLKSMEKLGSSITLIRELGFGPYPTSYLHQHFDHSKLVHWKMEDLEYTSELVVILEKKRTPIHITMADASSFSSIADRQCPPCAPLAAGQHVTCCFRGGMWSPTHAEDGRHGHRTKEQSSPPCPCLPPPRLWP